MPFQGHELATQPVLIEQHDATGIQEWQHLPVDVALGERHPLGHIRKVAPLDTIRDASLFGRLTLPSPRRSPVTLLML